MIRTLNSGEATPSTEPRRYLTTDGYWRLRWRVGPGLYVERLEHRAVASPGPGEHVHHKNGNPLDNRPENLELLTPSAHEHLHHHPKADPAEVAALYAAGLSTVEIGTRFGMNPSNVWRLMHRYGYSTRPLSDPSPRAIERRTAGVRRAYANRPPATTCRNGHPIAEAIQTPRQRVCRTCTAARSREYRARKRAAA